MLEKVILGNTVTDWGISIIIIIGTLLTAKLISLFNKKYIKPFLQKTKNNFDDIICNVVESPFIFGIVLIGTWVAIHRLIYPANFVTSLDSAFKVLIVLNITWFFVKLSESLLDYYIVGRSDKSRTEVLNQKKMMPIIRRTIVVFIWAMGIATALTNIGVNITALLGTLGIGGIAFALAAQDTIKNIFGAFTILTDRPFRIGDVVRIDSYEGTIIDVGVRSTKMRNYDKRIITLPNYKIADASIVNISAEPMRRITMKIGLTYDTSAEKMTKAFELLRNIPSKVEFVSSKDVTVNFTDFADSALVITFIYFIEKQGDVWQTVSNVNMEILSSFNKEKLDFAFPSQTLYLNKVDNG
ncbi:MAG: mechanosensitive ion channel family protein [Dysgonamonadaceae bacterium]|jgi:MscS family membrane protein|nr:mechanosensitive ion channel family protein [Dysgonamonadaceae bacterium]